MKTHLIPVLLLLSSAAATDSAFVSDNDVAITRAQVRKEPTQPERAGYRPGRANDPRYPETIQAALARIHVDDRVAGDASLSDYGNASGPAVSTMIAALRVRLAMRYMAGLCRESMSTPAARAIVAVNAPTRTWCLAADTSIVSAPCISLVSTIVKSAFSAAS
ncbi:DUF4148 domain-containing protein [Burkholderia pseudomultivorans]|uniref:DUF4148 domain-containing protein n=1 Tax=Burkholderia pseudomultivorans TaxID=1207504 RepID=UPI0009C07634|nr:DUF4148 domain-containing protein [Burkholderia pseudomultivorans]